MNAVSSDPKLWKRLTWFGVAAVSGGGCDLHTKTWAEQKLADLPGQSLAVIEPWLELNLAYNRGTAFSLVRDLGDARWIFGLLALAVVVILLFNVVRSRPTRTEVLALGAIAGGAIGNGIDRLIQLSPISQAGVVDFIKINYPWGGSWPTFNVADVLIAVGVGLLILVSFRRRKVEPAPAPEPSASPA